MVRHRRLFLALGLCALLGFTGREANAGNLTITVSWTGGSSGPIDFTSPEAVPGGSADLFEVNTTLLNAAIAASGYQFSELGGSSNNPGSPTGSILRVTGTALLNGRTPPSAITITAVQTGFTSPSGPGTLGSQSTANFRNTDGGSVETSNVSLDATVTPNLTFTPPGAFLMNSTAATGNPAGYTLDATVTLTLTGASGTAGASDQFSNNASFTAVPEPASIVMMLTGMPLPLVVMGLLRRRRATA